MATSKSDVDTYTVNWGDGKSYDVTLPKGASPEYAKYEVYKRYYAPKSIEMPEGSMEKPAPGVFQTVRHTAEREALPTAAAFAAAGLGAEYGAGVGTAILPIGGTLIGGGIGALIGGLGAGYAASKAQEKALESTGLDKTLGLDKETQEAEEKANPHAAMLTSVGMNLLGARPTKAGISALVGRGTQEAVKEARTAAAIHGGMFGGIDVAQQLAGDQPYDPYQTLANIGVGALSHKETTLGGKLTGAGGKLGQRLLPESMRPVRPVEPPKVAEPEEVAETEEAPAEEVVKKGVKLSREERKQKNAEDKAKAEAASLQDILGATTEPATGGVRPATVAGTEQPAAPPAGKSDVAGDGVSAPRDTTVQPPATETQSEGLATAGAGAKSVHGGEADVGTPLKTTQAYAEPVAAEGSAKDRTDLKAHIEKLEKKLDKVLEEGDYDSATSLEQEIAVAKDQLAKMGEAAPGEPLKPAPEAKKEVTPETMRTPATEVPKDLREAVLSGNWDTVVDHLAGGDIPDAERTVLQHLAKLLREGPEGYEDARTGEGRGIRYGQWKTESGKLKTNVKVNAEGAAGYDAEAIQSLKDRGKLAEYDPATNTIHVTEAGMSDETLLHETVHAATVKSLKDFENATRDGFRTREKLKAEAEALDREAVKARAARDAVRGQDLPSEQVDQLKAAADLADKRSVAANDAFQQHEDRLTAAAHVHNIFKEASSRSVLGQPLVNKYPEAFKNIYEFVAYAMTNHQFQQDLGKVKLDKKQALYTDRNMRYTEGLGGAVRSLWTEFTHAIARMLGLGRERVASIGESLAQKGEARIAELNQELEKARTEFEEAQSNKRRSELSKQIEALEDEIEKEGSQVAVNKTAPSRTYAKGEGNAALELVQAVSDLLQTPTQVRGVKPLSAVAPGGAPQVAKPAKPPKDFSPDAMRKRQQASDAKKLQEHNVMAQLGAWKNTRIGSGFSGMVTKLQNHARAIQELEEDIRRKKKLIPGYNDANLARMLKPTTAFTAQLESLKNALLDPIAEYARLKKMSNAEATAKLGQDLVSRREGDLRDFLFRVNVPLKNAETDKIWNLGNRKVTAADLRTEIVKRIPLAKNDAEALALYKKFLEVTDAKFHDASISADSPKAQILAALKKAEDPTRLLDINHKIYNVAGDAPAEAHAKIRAEFEAERKDPTLGPAIERFLEAYNRIHEKQIELLKESGHWGRHVDNAVIFQNGKETYAPLKSSQAPEADYIGNPRMAGEREDVIQATEGRFSDSDNPIFRSLADLDLAVNRVHRSTFLSRIHNLVKDGEIKGKILDPIELEDRDSDNAKKIAKQNKTVLQYDGTGKINVIRIDDPEMLAAIKGMTMTTGPWMSLLGSATRGVAMGFTRLNPFFAPKNFARHLLTNVSSIAAGEYGPVTAVSTLARAIGGLATLSPLKAARVANLVAKGDMAGLERLSKQGGFYKNIAEYILKGGPVTFKQAYTNAANISKAMRELNGQPFAKTRAAIDHVIEVWNNVFELLNREAAYGAIKAAELRKEGSTEETAKQVAAGYTKGLLNLEEQGQYGKTMASWFALWKAEATGAVRSIDAFLPMFQSAESQLKRFEPLTEKEIEEGKTKRYRKELTAEEKANFIENHNKLRRNSALTATAMLGMGMFLYSRAKDSAPKDEQGRNIVSTDDKSLWVRNMRIPARVLFGDDYEKAVGKGNDFVSLAWGFGGGAFAAMGAQMQALLDGDISFGEATKHMASAATESFLPIPTAGSDLFAKNPLGWAASSVAPTVARPWLEFAWNADDFGRQIYNNRLSKYGNAYTGGDYVAEVWKDAAQFMRDKFDIDVQPSTLQFFAQNYSEGVGMLSQGSYNQYLAASGQRDFDPRDLNPLRNFLAHSSNYDARQFSDVEKKIKQFNTHIEAYKVREDDEGLDRYLEKNPNAEDLVKTYNKVKNHLNKLNAKMNAINASGMSPKEKAEELEDLKQERNTLMAEMVGAYTDSMD